MGKGSDARRSDQQAPSEAQSKRGQDLLCRKPLPPTPSPQRRGGENAGSAPPLRLGEGAGGWGFRQSRTGPLAITGPVPFLIVPLKNLRPSPRCAPQLRQLLVTLSRKPKPTASKISPVAVSPMR